MNRPRGFKVPFRECYCNRFKDCVKHTIWCHFVIRIFPNCYDFNSDPLLKYYGKKKGNLYNQIEFIIDRALIYQKYRGEE